MSKHATVAALLVLVAAAIVACFAYYEYHYESKIIDYISDECWYVSAARNILRTYFGITPHGPWGGVMATVEFKTPPTQQMYRLWANEAVKYVKSIGGRVVKGINYYKYSSNGNYLPAICVVVPPSNVSKLKDVPHETMYAIGYCYPNAAGILTYMNFEHPPLVKYFLDVIMVTVGDYPPYWRIPSILAGCGTLVLIFLALRRMLGRITGAFLGVAAMLLTVFDITFRSMSMVAMLDIFVAFFTYLTYYMMVRKRLAGTAIALGLGFISKWTGIFQGLPALIGWLRSKRKPADVLLYLIYVPAAMFVLSALPFIIHDGFMTWWANGVVGAIKWHLSIKTTGGPPKALPWDWIIGRNAFPLHYVFNSKTGQWVADLIAAGNPPVYMLLAALSIYVIPALKKLPDRGFTWGFTWGTFFMYIFIYLLGAKTQYSFYSVQIVPLFYTLLVIEIYYMLSPPRNFIEIAKRWWSWILTFWDWLTGYAEIRLKIEVARRPPAEGRCGAGEAAENECRVSEGKEGGDDVPANEG